MQHKAKMQAVKQRIVNNRAYYVRTNLVWCYFTLDLQPQNINCFIFTVVQIRVHCNSLGQSYILTIILRNQEVVFCFHLMNTLQTKDFQFQPFTCNHPRVPKRIVEYFSTDSNQKKNPEISKTIQVCS